MAIVSDRRYRFDVDRDQFWSTIANVTDYPRWWPWLRDFDGAALADGDQWQCTVQPPLPYTVRFTLALVEVNAPRSVLVSISGDIVGDASIDIEQLDAGCEVRLRSDLSPNNLLLRGVALAARPIAQFGHDWVLDTGARQFGGSVLR